MPTSLRSDPSQIFISFRDTLQLQVREICGLLSLPPISCDRFLSNVRNQIDCLKKRIKVEVLNVPSRMPTMKLMMLPLAGGGPLYSVYCPLVSVNFSGSFIALT